jgi:hypothetical protein
MLMLRAGRVLRRASALAALLLAGCASSGTVDAESWRTHDLLGLALVSVGFAVVGVLLYDANRE